MLPNPIYLTKFVHNKISPQCLDSYSRNSKVSLSDITYHRLANLFYLTDSNDVVTKLVANTVHLVRYGSYFQ